MNDKDKNFVPVPNDSSGMGTMLNPNTKDCPKCGAKPDKFEVRNYSLMWHDGDVHCTVCGQFIRTYDAG